MAMEILAILSASAAAGMRIALPLLVVGLLYGERFWSQVPLLSSLNPTIILAILISWSLLELLGSKTLLGQRSLEWLEICLTPFVGALMAVTVVEITNQALLPTWLVAFTGGLLAFVLKLAQLSWLVRLRRLPLAFMFFEDVVCVLLVLFAFKAPEEGGLIALLFLWIAIRSVSDWRNRLKQQRSQSQHHGGLNHNPTTVDG